MRIKCLVSFEDENFVLYLNGNKIDYLIKAIRIKSNLSNLLVFGNLETNYIFKIFDNDFNTFVILDDETDIENLSKIKIFLKPNNIQPINKQIREYHHFNNNQNVNDFSCLQDIQEPMVVNVNPNDFSSNHSDSNLLNNKSNLIDNETEIESENEHSNCIQNFNSNNMDLQVIKKEVIDPKVIETNLPLGSQEVEWTEDNVFVLLDCCKNFLNEFYPLNVNENLTDLDPNSYYPKEELWEMIAEQVRNRTFIFYDKAHCKNKFMKLRATYININAYPSLKEETKWPFLKELKILIDDLKPLSDNSQMKTPNRSKDRNSSAAYLYLIQLVKKHINEFSNARGQKYKIWRLISIKMNEAGYELNGKSCQNLFHRLRYTFLHLLKTLANEVEAQRRWPYFSLFQDIDLTPFKTRRNIEGKRKNKVREKINSIYNTTQNKTDSQMAEQDDEELDDEEDDEEVEEEDFDMMSHYDENNFTNCLTDNRLKLRKN